MIDVVLDLSHHQVLTGSAFNDMKRAGIKGIIHKASQGTASKDAQYRPRAARAASVELLWGAYHFGTKNDPVSQAEHFVKAIGEDADNPKILLCLDWEGNKSYTMTRSGAEAFVSHIFRLTCRWPVLYSGHSFLNSAMRGVAQNETVLSNCPLWLARYGPREPVAPRAWSQVDLWQYTSEGRSAGVVGNVDRNRFKGTLDELKAWW